MNGHSSFLVQQIILHLKSNMEVIDLGAKVPAKLKHSHLSKISKKRSLSPSSGSSSRNLSPDVISKIESRKSELIDVIQLILQSKELKHSYEWYYTTTERLCRFKPIEQSFLSKAIFDALEDYYVNEVGPKLKGVFTENINGTTVEIAEARARGFLDVYEDYDRKTRLLGKVFLYLDRSYLKQHPVKKVIMEFGLKMLVDDICTNFAITVKKDENIEGETGEDIDMDIDIDKEPVTSITALSTMLQIPTTLLHSVRVSKFESPLIPITTSFISGLVKLNNSFDSPFPLNRTFIDRSITDHSIISKQTLKNSPSTYFSSFQSYLTLELSFMISCNESKKTRDTFQSKFTWCWIFKNLNSVLKLIFPTISKENLLSLFKLCQGAELEYKIDACGIFKYEWNENLLKRFQILYGKQNLKVSN